MQSVRVQDLLVCPDCRRRLDDSLVCAACRRSLAPDADGIISAMPREFAYVATLTDLGPEISRSVGDTRAKKVVRFEEAFHDEQAAYYDEMNSDPEPVKSYIRTLVEKHIYRIVSRSEFVVDLCCGTGKGSLPLLGRGMTVVGMDVSREMLRVYARKTGVPPNLVLIHADGTNPPLAPKACPAIQIVGGLHHIPDRQACVHNCSHALRSGGVLIIHEPLKTGSRHWMLPALQNIDALTNPRRVAQAIRRRLGGSGWKEDPDGERLDVTPYEQAFTSADELRSLLPAGEVDVVELRSKLVLSDWRFGPHLQRVKAAARIVVALDEWLSRTGRAGWTGNAIYGVFRKR